MAVQVSRTAPTWVQLTYTSADAIAGVKGGWGVKEAVPPNAPAHVVGLLQEGITTRIQEVVETSQFASTAELADRVRRLVFRVVDGVPGLWHAIAAGLDATGRPGNVYNHAAGLVPDDPAVRPIDYWRSDDWLVPFGAAAVTAARLGQLRPGKVVTRDSTIQFLRADDRVFNLEWILAAVAHVSRGNTRLVLVSDSPDEAAAWIGSITHLTSVGLGRRLSWSTFERASGLAEQRLADLRIVAVPRADLAELEGQTAMALVVDPTWSLEDPEGGSWRTPLGQTFPADQRWQSGLIDLFALDDDARIQRILAAADDITASFDAQALASLPLHWALSMVMLADPDVAVIDRPGLTFECLRVAPAAALEVPAVQTMLDKVTADLRGDAVRDQVQNGSLGPLLQRVAAAAVMKEYIAGGWKTQSQPGLPPQLVVAALDDNAAMLPAAIEAAKNAATGAPPAQVVAAAQFVSLLLDHPGLGRGPGEIDMAVTVLSSRLANADMAIHLDQISVMHQRLGAAVGAARKAPVTAPLPEVPRRDELRRADPPGVVTTSSPPMQQPVYPASAPPLDAYANSVQMLSDDVGTALSELLVDVPLGSARYFGLADGIRVSRGMRAVPLSDLWERYQPEVDKAFEQWRDQRNPAPVRAVFSSWLTAMFALRESGKGSNEAVKGLLEAIREQEEAHLVELVRLVENAPPQRAALLAEFAIRKRFIGKSNSVLGLELKDGSPFGFRAVSEAFRKMTPARHSDVWGVFGPQVPIMQASLGNFSGEIARMADELKGGTVGMETPAQTGRRVRS